MTSTTPTTFATTWKRYAVVHAQCETLSGKALSKAQDAENAATDALIETRTGSPAEIAKKIDATEDYLRVGGNTWFDNRVERMLDSVKRDLRALARRAGAA